MLCLSKKMLKLDYNRKLQSYKYLCKEYREYIKRKKVKTKTASDAGLERRLSKFANTTKLRAAADSLVGREALQKDLYK